MLPVATEATVEHELKRLGNTELLNWNLEVAGLSLDRSSLLTPRLAPRLTPLLLPLQVAGLAAAHMAMPYEMPMSAEELLQELVCQRLDQDFQLLGSMQHSGSEDRRVYFLSHSQQLQIITMTKERKSTMRGAPPASDKINIECHRRLRPPSDLREQQYAYLVGHSHTDGFLR